MSTPELYYAYASFIGFSQGSSKKCEQAYGKCPYDGHRMMDVYKTAYNINRKKDLGHHGIEYLPFRH